MSVNGCAWRRKGCACKTQKARATLKGSLTHLRKHVRRHALLVTTICRYNGVTRTRTRHDTVYRAKDAHVHSVANEIMCLPAEQKNVVSQDQWTKRVGDYGMRLRRGRYHHRGRLQRFHGS
jgi:hypothetical protein